MTVSHILGGKGRNVVTLPPSTSVSDVVKFLAEHRIGAIIIVGASSEIEGIVSERDVVRHLAKHGQHALAVPVSDIMTRSVRTCKEDDSEADLMQLMTEHRIRHLPVVTNGKLIGIVSIGDVVKYRMQTIERESDEMKAYIATAG